ncbi:Na+/H+ antiporter NhaA [Photobacterium proteolyticum]|uniref:Na(+)/H(+) antiporter NhaA n=1 Tax=Photobacterium proteolyticum TaxID=1903952 RepID=A0A1Q9GLY9_9GAMM|nr:Na+/H+ antiporter NhaA [Photobacterium proteolyticum]OLQ75559.1 Na+/H+ antiporter NhaA [Photobacterium proteolyticum]
MENGHQNKTEIPQLPQDLIDKFTKPIKRFLHIQASASLVLLLFTVIALVLSHSMWGDAFLAVWETPMGINVGSLIFVRSLREWINDALMTLFFFLVALELKRELVLGELKHPRIAALSIIAAFGGMLVPAALYLMLQSDQPGENGWGTVMATDTAFVIGCLGLLGTRIPHSLRIFMLSMSIVDDIGAVLVVAISYGNSLRWEVLVLAVAGIVIIRGMGLLGIRNVAIYSLAGGGLWILVDASGIHATVTGVILGLMTPTEKWVSGERLHAILANVVAYPLDEHWESDTLGRKALQMAEAAAHGTLSPVERLVMVLHPWVGFVILPLFAFANAGIQVSSSDFGNPVTIAVFMGFALGKPLGVFGFSWLAVRTGIAILPLDLNWKLLAGGSLLAGTGFTMALFIANLAFSSDLIDDAKLGILSASVFSSMAGILILSRWSHKGKYPKNSNEL